MTRTPEDFLVAKWGQHCYRSRVMNRKTYFALALFSGGLDSILACKVLEAQGRSVLALHFVSPFFGKPQAVNGWRRDYGLDIRIVDVAAEYVDTLLTKPARGYGRFLNPCVDCHAFMVRKAVELLPEYDAKCIITGEVLGQRPMSQRRDALDCVRNDAGAGDVLLRPLSALVLPPTPVELKGLVDRQKLHGISGRARSAQAALAATFGIPKKLMPSSSGGCRLTEPIPSARYLAVLKACPQATATDFYLCNHGRVLWKGPHFLAVGRDRADNEALTDLAGPGDLLFQARGVPGPLGVGRQFPGQAWDEETIASAAALTASFSPRLRTSPDSGAVQVRRGPHDPAPLVIPVAPGAPAPDGWAEPAWDALKDDKLRIVALGA